MCSLVAMTATVALTAGAGSAAASGTHGDTVVNPGSVTLTATNPTIEIFTLSGTRTLRCTGISVPARVDAAGAVTVAARAASFTACGLSGVAVTVTQTLGWTGVFRHLDGALSNVVAATLDLDVPVGGGIQATGIGCSFSLGGRLLGDRAVGPVAHGVAVSVPAIGFVAALGPAWGLVVTAASGAGCAPLGAVVGNDARVSGSFTLAPALSVRG